METNFLKLYVELNKTLIKTLVVKSLTTITMINDYLRLKHGDDSVDLNDPLTWKYYLNISGNYHPLDTVMTVTSLDTLQTIVFSKENLILHTATAEAYTYGSRYYHSLLSRYPEQEHLILGILYPADINEAIAADDGSILSYPKELVEPQEITLISDLDAFIKRYQVRWDVKAFAISDGYYAAAQTAVLFMNLVPKLLNLRLKRCKTHEAHSFHIREYLASHEGLDRFLPYLTLKQSLFLYRNICYLERNSGKTEQFKKLVERLLTERRIPLNEFSIRQLSTFDANFYPEINVRRKAVNTQYNVPEKDYFDLPTLYLTERPLVYGNANFYDSQETRITRQLSNSVASVIQTKDLESKMVDYNDAVPDPLEVVLLRQWAYLAGKGYYQSIVNFKDPKTLETRSLTALDAFIYMTYITSMSLDILIDEVPLYINIKVRKHPLPTKEELYSIVDHGFPDLLALAEKLIQDQPIINQIVSSKQFYELNHKIFEQSRVHWFLTSSIEDYYKRGLVANMIYHLYFDEAMLLTPTATPMAGWLAARNLPTYDYTYAQSVELTRNIFTAATHLVIDNTKLLKNIQKAMISILTQLSSYSVQVITEINHSAIRPLNWAAIRLGNIRSEYLGYFYVNDEILVNEMKGSSAVTHDLEAFVNKHFDQYLVDQRSHLTYESKVTTVLDYGYETFELLLFPSFSIEATYPGYDPAVSNTAKFIGWEYYLDLSDTQKQQIKSIH